MLVHRLDDQTKREILLELRGSPDKDEVPAAFGSPGQLGQHPRLADSRFTHGAQEPRASSGQPLESRLDLVDLVRATDELAGPTLPVSCTSHHRARSSQPM